MIGKYGSLRKTYLMEHKPAEFNALSMHGELWTYLADVNEQAIERLHTMMNQMMKNYGVTEELKEKDQLEWVRQVNNIKAMCEEIIYEEFVYVYLPKLKQLDVAIDAYNQIGSCTAPWFSFRTTPFYNRTPYEN
jgi:hypothetical protein